MTQNFDKKGGQLKTFEIGKSSSLGKPTKIHKNGGWFVPQFPARTIFKDNIYFVTFCFVFSLSFA